MRTRFLLGPAGTGKTFRCLAEIRAALTNSPDGSPLILLAPKQATFQLERQLLSEGNLSGYTRLQILSFERLATFILTGLQREPKKMLSEEGRVMVLRALLLQNKEKLKIFRSSARMPGFAQQLSLLLREFQRHQLSPVALSKLSGKIESQLSAKLHDLALLLDAYFNWLKTNDLQDANGLLDLAAEALRVEKASSASASQKIAVAGLWLDGFAEMTPQETNLLAAFLPHCDEATLAFCLEQTDKKISGLSIWSAVHKTVQDCRGRIELQPDCQIETEILTRDPARNRFAQAPALAHLEKHWTRPEAFSELEPIQDSLRLSTCLNPEAEAVLAAHEILKFVRNGGRYRNVAVILRQFDGYHNALRRVFSRYEIPFFLDRRESIAHHPLAELTRSAVRLAAFGWEHDDFFCALKTGFVIDNESAIDQLENESLARGWKKEAWLRPLEFPAPQQPNPALERLRQSIVPPFQKFSESIGAKKSPPTGDELAQAIRALWNDLEVEKTLEDLAEISPVHATVWDQMQSWLDNLALAFPGEPLRLNEWLPILEAGLSNLTVGAIPPALDQVLIGTIDRSRNPDLEMTLVLGLNESVFPAPPSSGNLLTETDHEELSKYDILLGLNKLESLGRERFYGYIACTRARKRLVLTCAAQDNEGRAQNPSSFFSLFSQLFPSLPRETVAEEHHWVASQHRNELIAPLIAARESENLSQFSDASVFDSVRGVLEHFASLPKSETLSTEMAGELYGSALQSSVSALEQFAACPFRFFVSAGMRAQERRVFEVDVREKGSFQHAVLRRFHEQLRDEEKRWRDISTDDARERIAEIGTELKTTFRNGLFGGDAQNDFAARSMIESLQDFIEATIGWMQQYEFDPHAVELGFGAAEKTLPAWEIDLTDGHKLALRGIIDRVDICPLPGGEKSLAVIIDYKSSARQLDAVSLAHGLQLQLPAYLAFLRRLPDAGNVFGVKQLVPAGVFYVNLRGEFSGGKTRDQVLDGLKQSRQMAFQHSGRFDCSALSQLDNRNEKSGTQFKYRLTNSGEPHGASREILRPEKFLELLDSVEQQLVQMGIRIFAGDATIDPYQKGNVRACDQCDYSAICRIDPWEHKFRILK